jgi:pilus assembly protein CpaD
MRRVLILTLPLSLGGCLDQNLGLESQHKPVVTADGKAVVHGCPDWHSQNDDSAAGTDSNYGCATNANLAAMIANPQDLIHGAVAASGESSDVAVRAIAGGHESAPSGHTSAAAAPRGEN